MKRDLNFWTCITLIIKSDKVALAFLHHSYKIMKLCEQIWPMALIRRFSSYDSEICLACFVDRYIRRGNEKLGTL